jgi:16S rRNA (cytosine967-C5)-methyltransferase
MIVKQKLENAGIEFRAIAGDGIALSNASKLDEIIEINNEAVVQDYSSQRVGDLLSPLKGKRPTGGIRVWDCCAASGGKSIMLCDINPAIDLTVSDIRESILINLRKRFNEAGIKKYSAFVTDLSGGNIKMQASNFDLIICDAPCTGSGTWSRTPEQLFYFDENKIDKYAVLQKQIANNTIPFLKEGGYFLYITCSVFKKENEVVVDFIKNKFALDVVQSGIIAGYDIKADTMFAALLQKGSD